MSEAIVLGAGIAGLWTASVLVERGHRVVVRAAASPERTYSSSAACVLTPLLPWEPNHPRFVTGWGWYRRTINRFRSIDATRAFEAKFLEPMPSFECGFESDGVRYLEKGFSTTKFRFLPFTELVEIELSPPVKVKNHLNEVHECSFCASFTADYCNTEIFLEWLHKSLIAQGVLFIYEPVRSLKEVISLEQELIFNCMGFDSAAVFPDASLFPVRGQSMFVDTVESKPPYFGIASGHHAVFKHRKGFYVGSYFIEDDSKSRSVPSQVEYDLSLEFLEKSYPELCQRLGFDVPKIELNRIRRVNTGIRPYRANGPRIEAEILKMDSCGKAKKVVHHYGHGAHGWTVGFATAEDAVNLAEIKGWLEYVPGH